ncbi:AAA domain protein [Kordia sp. SMS9]|uniref:AAA family ATPase n=1 Tax=Kordia sp. SMS9 TaxID=2282170 RepID=UPI000E0CCDAB|nr:AAA family ATPase [Kordia sp. SMS9]AXG70464.1 AAA domain protein [Kordia sp. SMS9]
MNELTKNKITNALNTYFETSSESQNKFSKRNDINVSIVSAIRNGTNTIGKSIIADKWYNKIAQAIDYTSKSYWDIINTSQSAELLNSFEESRQKGVNRTVIGDTGIGKTEIAKRYKNKYPDNTYMITVGMHLSPKDFLMQLAYAMNAKFTPGSNHRTLLSIVNKIQNLYLSGNAPLIIIDETENLKLQVVGYIKALYDYLDTVCPVVLIGTDQLIDNIERWNVRNKQGIPQFWRRFRVGVRHLPTVKNKDITEMLEAQGVTDQALVNYLIENNYNNYGLLNNAIVYAKKEAERIGSALTLDLFLTVHDLKRRKA